MSVASPASSGRSAVLAAARRIAGVGDALGEEALRLAYHAAVPVVVDAEFLNLLRVNFSWTHLMPWLMRLRPICCCPLSSARSAMGLFEIEPGL